MNKADFNSLIHYIANRPTEAARLLEVLSSAVMPGDKFVSTHGKEIGKASAEATNEWVTASVAGQAIHMSGKWMKEHHELFPSAFVGQVGNKKQWFFNLQEVRPIFNAYIQR